MSTKVCTSLVREVPPSRGKGAPMGTKARTSLVKTCLLSSEKVPHLSRKGPAPLARGIQTSGQRDPDLSPERPKPHAGSSYPCMQSPPRLCPLAMTPVVSGPWGRKQRNRHVPRQIEVPRRAFLMPGRASWRCDRHQDGALVSRGEMGRETRATSSGGYAAEPPRACHLTIASKRHASFCVSRGQSE
jgi:hypothetical protein